jgi:hypothetical protein
MATAAFTGIVSAVSKGVRAMQCRIIERDSALRVLKARCKFAAAVNQRVP